MNIFEFYSEKKKSDVPLRLQHYQIRLFEALMREFHGKNSLLDARTIPRRVGKTKVLLDIARENNCALLVPNEVIAQSLRIKNRDVEILSARGISASSLRGKRTNGVVMDEIPFSPDSVQQEIERAGMQVKTGYSIRGGEPFELYEIRGFHEKRR